MQRKTKANCSGIRFKTQILGMVEKVKHLVTIEKF